MENNDHIKTGNRISCGCQFLYGLIIVALFVLLFNNLSNSLSQLSTHEVNATATVRALKTEATATASTPEPTEIPGYQGIYGWEGDFVFCVMASALNIRNTPAGSVINRFDKGDLFTIDLASQRLADGYVWAKHDKGWSALFRYPGGGRIDEFTHPKACPAPTPRPTATRVSRTTSTRSVATCQDRNLVRVAQRKQRDVRRAKAICTTKHIMVDFKLQDNLFFGPLTVAKHAMYDLLCELRIHGYGITFDIDADFVDAAGNESESRALLARFEPNTVRRINCNSFAGMLNWETLAESWWVHPSVK